MILVDTTVWVDFFANRATPQVTALINQIENNNELCLCGIVLTEILQGIKNSNEYHRVQEILNSLLFIDMTKDTFVLSAEIYRKLRAKGITIRKTMDCMIAAIAIENKIPLLHNDRDFDSIEKHLGLKVVSAIIN